MSFWRIFHNLVRHDDSPEETARANKACEWLAENGLKLRQICSSQRIEILSQIACFWYKEKMAPSYAILRETIERNSTVLGVIDEIADYESQEELKIHSINDLGQLLTDFQDEWKRERLAQVLKIVRAINNSSWTNPKDHKVYSGSTDAIKFMLQQLETGVITTGNPALSGALNDTAKEVMGLYDGFKADRMVGSHRIYTGIHEIDVHVPIKRGDFVGVLGYAGQRKSTLCRTMAYNAAKQGFNVLHVTLEQTYNEERINYSLIHSADPKFANYNLKPSKKNFEDGCLSKAEEKYLRDIVLPDLEENLPGRLIIRQPTDGTSWSSIKMLAEMTNQTTPIDMFFVDYLGLVSTNSGRDAREEMERNIKDAKQMALQFDNGRGVVFLTPIQGNRKGYEEAKNTNGVWDLTGINLYSEFDKSADLILSTFIDEALQEESSISISSVKIRRAPPLPLFTTPVNCHVGLIGAPYSLSLAREEDEVGFSTLDNMFRTIENAV